MRKIIELFRILPLMILLSVALPASAGESAADFLGRAVAKISRAGSVQASFSMSGSQGSASGTITTQGKKFAVITGGPKSWYDGKSMWTYNPSSRETTLVNPTAQELQEANPLQLMQTSSQFTVAWGTGAPAGHRRVVLTPKSKRMGLKKVTITLNASSLLPVSLTVLPSGGGTLNLNISKVKLGAKYPASTFVYPSKSYPRVKVVDLR